MCPSPITIEAAALLLLVGCLKVARASGNGIGAFGPQGGDETGIAGCRGLHSAWRMGGEVHQNEGRLLIGSGQSRGVGQRLPSPHVVLDLSIVEGRNKPLNEEDVVPRGGVRVGQMVQNSHPGVELLDRLVGELDYAGELSPQQLGVALGKEPPLVFIQSLLRGLGPCEGNVHDRL